MSGVMNPSTGKDSNGKMCRLHMKVYFVYHTTQSVSHLESEITYSFTKNLEGDRHRCDSVMVGAG